MSAVILIAISYQEHMFESYVQFVLALFELCPFGNYVQGETQGPLLLIRERAAPLPLHRVSGCFFYTPVSTSTSGTAHYRPTDADIMVSALS